MMKIWDDYDDCIIGVGTRSGMVDVFIYDKHRMITKLVKRDDMSYDEAREFIDALTRETDLLETQGRLLAQQNERTVLRTSLFFRTSSEK